MRWLLDARTIVVYMSEIIGQEDGHSLSLPPPERKLNRSTSKGQRSNYSRHPGSGAKLPNAGQLENQRLNYMYVL